MIEDNVTYNLEFKLPSISEHFYLQIGPEVLDINHDATAHSKIHQAPYFSNDNEDSNEAEQGPFEHEQAEPMARTGQAALAGI